MCGCSGSLPSVPGLPAPAVAPSGTKFVVTYPNGGVQEFDHEWAAAGAVAMSGGTMTIIGPGAATPPGEPAPAG